MPPLDDFSAQPQVPLPVQQGPIQGSKRQEEEVRSKPWTGKVRFRCLNVCCVVFLLRQHWWCVVALLAPVSTVTFQVRSPCTHTGVVHGRIYEGRFTTQ